MLDQKIPQLYHNYHNYTTILDLEMSRENLASRSLDRPRELIVFFIAPFSRIEMLKRNVESKFSFSSRTTRKNLDIVKKKLEYIVYFNHQMMIKEKHTTFPNITTLISKKTFHVYLASGETFKSIKTKGIESVWTKVRVQQEIWHLQLSTFG